MNLYGFVNNDAIAQVDARGLITIKVPNPISVGTRAASLFAHLLSLLVDHQYVKKVRVFDVECPQGSTRVLVEHHEIREEKIQGVWVYATSSLLRPFINYSAEIRTPKTHTIVKKYECCKCFKSSRGTRLRPMKTVVDIDRLTDDEGFLSFDDGELIGEIGYKTHYTETKRVRECTKVEPLRRFTRLRLPDTQY